MRSGPTGTSASASYAGVACDKTHLSHVTRSDINPTGAERPGRKLIATQEMKIRDEGKRSSKRSKCEAPVPVRLGCVSIYLTGMRTGGGGKGEKDTEERGGIE